MKITFFLALVLAAVYVSQAEPLHKEDTQGFNLEEVQDTGSAFRELSQERRLKRATCAIDQCSAFCGKKGRSALCRKGHCKCY